MNKLVTIVGSAIIGLIVVFFISTVGGTILYFIYPHIHALFPTAASNGVIAKELGWWDSICISWIFGLLVKGYTSTTTKTSEK